MSIVIFGDLFSFPEGDAATNRVHTYAKGFSENGRIVHVICFENKYNVLRYGETNGIHYYYPFQQKKRSKNFFIRRWHKFKKYLEAIQLFRNINKYDKIITIICYTQLLQTQSFAFILSKFIKSKIILERSEHPLRNYGGIFFKKLHGKFKIYLEIRLCDAIFCISRYLIKFYESKGYDSKKLFLVPSTVDPARFIQTHGKLFQFPYIGYFGGLTFWRDNIDILIKAFGRISSSHPEVHLVLGGFCTEHEREQIENLIANLKIEKRVKLLDYLKRDEILNYITNADILVMVRTDNLESKASFPSKLTEFLATSIPVITVNVGEISDYVTDGIDAFLIKPGDPDELEYKLNFVLDNYSLAREVGLRGKELTRTIFNYNYQTKRMITFIDSLTYPQSKKNYSIK